MSESYIYISKYYNGKMTNAIKSRMINRKIYTVPKHAKWYSEFIKQVNKEKNKYKDEKNYHPRYFRSFMYGENMPDFVSSLLTDKQIKEYKKVGVSTEGRGKYTAYHKRYKWNGKKNINKKDK